MTILSNYINLIQCFLQINFYQRFHRVSEQTGQNNRAKEQKCRKKCSTVPKIDDFGSVLLPLEGVQQCEVQMFQKPSIFGRVEHFFISVLLYFGNVEQTGYFKRKMSVSIHLSTNLSSFSTLKKLSD